jgi:hypothetical protein
MAKKRFGVPTDALTQTVESDSLLVDPNTGLLTTAPTSILPAVDPVDPKLCPREIVFTIPGAPGVTVTGMEDGAGNLDFTATVNTTATLTGDIGGLFFQLNDAKLAGLTVAGPAVTVFQAGDDNVIKVAPGVNMEGAQAVPYDVGVEFGTAGIGANHQDITSASFVVSNAAHNLTLDDLLQPGETNLFGARVTAVGVPGGSRPASEKITGDATQPITAKPDSISALEDGSVTIKASDLATDPNPNGGALIITQVTQPADGTVTIALDGSSLTFTPGDFVPNGAASGSFQYCVHDALGSEDSNTISTMVTPVADQPSIVITALASGQTANDTLITFTASAGDFGTPQQGSDFLQSLSLALSGNVTNGVTLSDTMGLLDPVTNTFNLGGLTQTFTDTIDVKAPSIGAVGPLPLNLADILGITAVNAETEGFGTPATASAMASQAINIDYSQDSQVQDFQAVNQSIWTTGTAFQTDFHRFLGIDTGFHGKVGGTALGFGLSAGGTISLKTGFQADLHVDSGSFSAHLPFNVTLDTTYNKTTDTLQIDPTATGLPGGQISSTGPNGNLELDFIFNAMAKYFAKATAFGTTVANPHGTLGPYKTTLTIVKLDSSKLSTSIPIPPGDPIATLTFAWPQLNTTPTGSAPGSASSAGTSNPIADFKLDLVALALAALGINPDPLDFSVAGLTVDLLSLDAGFGIDTQQQLNLNAIGLDPMLTVGTGATAQMEPLNFNGAPTVIHDVSSLGLTNGAVPLSLALTPQDPTLQNITSLGGKLDFGLTVGKFDFHGIGGALFDQTVNIPLGNVPIYKNTFAVNFQSQTEHVNVA